MANIPGGTGADTGIWNVLVNTTGSNVTTGPGIKYYPAPDYFHFTEDKTAQVKPHFEPESNWQPIPTHIPPVSVPKPDPLAERQVQRYYKMPSNEHPPELQQRIILLCKQFGMSGEVVLEAIRQHVAKEKAEWDQDLPAEA